MSSRSFTLGDNPFLFFLWQVGTNPFQCEHQNGMRNSQAPHHIPVRQLTLLSSRSVSSSFSTKRLNLLWLVRVVGGVTLDAFHEEMGVRSQ